MAILPDNQFKFFIMEEKPKDDPEQKELGLMNRQDSSGCLFRGFILIVIPIILILIACQMCSQCGSSSYDDRWDRLEHSVESDPYYKQW